LNLTLNIYIHSAEVGRIIVVGGTQMRAKEMHLMHPIGGRAGPEEPRSLSCTELEFRLNLKHGSAATALKSIREGLTHEIHHRIASAMTGCK
jgi:hypothetical protein